MRFYLALCFFLPALYGSASQAADSTKTISGWMVTKSKDDFSDEPKVIISKVGDNGAIAFRCFGTDPSLMIIAFNKYEEGGTFTATVRVDKNTAIDGIATALTDHGLQLGFLDNEIFKQSKSGKSIAVRLSNGISSRDYKFSLANIEKVFQEIALPCKINE